MERYCLKKGRYGGPKIYNWDEELRLTAFEMQIELWEIFEKEKKEEKKE